MEDSRCRMMRWGPLRTSYCVLRKGAFINDTSEATDEVNTQYEIRNGNYVELWTNYR